MEKPERALAHGRMSTVAVALFSLNLAACALGALETGDEPMPSLGPNDKVTVSPECVVIPTSTNAIAIQQRLVTVSATRPTGAGAESVPVTFTLGSCGVSVSGRSVDAGADAALNTDAGVVAETADANSGGEPYSCGVLSADLKYLSRFRLVSIDAARCRSDNTSQVLCALDRNGTISIGVESAGSEEDAAVLELRAAPLCIAIREFATSYSHVCTNASRGRDGWTSGSDGWRYKTIRLLPASDESKAQVNITLSDVGGFNSDCYLDGDNDACTDRHREVANLAVGLVGSDVPPGSDVSENQYLIPLKEMKVQLSFEPSNYAWLCDRSGDGGYDISDGGATNQQSISHERPYLTNLAVCSDYTLKDFAVRAAIDNFAPTTRSIRALDTMVSFAKEGNTVKVTYCSTGEKTLACKDIYSVTYGNRLPIATGDSNNPFRIDGDRLCEVQAGFGDDAGADTARNGAGSSDASTSNKCSADISFSLTDGRTCNLEEVSL